MHTPSAYTLTNTTRPSRIKRKNPRIPCDSVCVITRANALDRGRIGILAKEQIQNNSDRNQRKQKITSQNGRRVAPRELKTAGMRVPFQYTTHRSKKLPWFTSVQPRALTHFSIHEHACVRARVFTHTIHKYSHIFTLPHT